MPKIEIKQEKVSAIKANMEGATSAVLVDHRGLSVEQDTILRKSLREANVTYKVYKNSMMNFAFEGTDFESLKEYLAGPSAVAFSYDDPTAAARVLAKAAKDFKALEFKAGVVEGIVYDETGIKAIAAIPPREELLSKLLGSLNSPIASFARTMKALAEKVEETGSATAAALVSDAAPVVEEAPAVEEAAPAAEAVVEEAAPVAEATETKDEA